MGIALYNYNKNFIILNNPNYWYISGLLAADGYISDETVELVLNEKDFHIIESIRNIICNDKPIYYKSKTNAYCLKLNNKILSSHYKELFSMTSNLKHKEMIFPNIPDEYLKDFIRGYIDGDGCIDKAKAQQIVNNEKVYYHGIRLRILGNYNFLYEMNEQIKKFVPNKTKAIHKKGKENVFVVTYNFSTAKQILGWIYSDNPELFLHRKYKKFLSLT